MPRSPFGLPTVILTNIAGLLIDAVLQEETTDEWRLSDIPLETGAIATDHRAKLPRKYTGNFRISDTPELVNISVSESYYRGLGIEVINQSFRGTVGGLIGGLVSSFIGGDSIAAYQELRRVADEGSFFTIVYGLGRLTDMQFASISAPRTSKDGRSIMVSGKLQQMIITDSSEVKAENISEDINHTAVEPQNLGLQPTAEL